MKIFYYHIVLISLLLTFIITSCDPGETVRYSIDNQSDFNIQVYYEAQNKNRDIFDTLKIVYKENYSEFYTLVHIGNGFDDTLGFLTNNFDSIKIYINNDTLQLTKDYEQRKNWEFKILNTFFFRPNDIEYVFMINNQSFE